MKTIKNFNLNWFRQNPLTGNSSSVTFGVPCRNCGSCANQENL